MTTYGVLSLSSAFIARQDFQRENLRKDKMAFAVGRETRDVISN